jgi:RNA polymerase sigma-70 factor (ECF subfamily)
MRELRESLSEEDQSLLMLRVDRKLSWKDLAVALSDGKEMNEAELAKKASNLRQSFQKVKNRLRSLAEEEGLLSDNSSSSS